MERTLNKISLILDLGCNNNLQVVQTPKHLQHGPKQSHNARNRHAPLSMQAPMTQNLRTTTLTLLWTLKSDREAISSSSSRVAEEADILACCCAGVSSCPSVCSSDTANGVGLKNERNLIYALSLSNVNITLVTTVQTIWHHLYVVLTLCRLHG